MLLDIIDTQLYDFIVKTIVVGLFIPITLKSIESFSKFRNDKKTQVRQKQVELMESLTGVVWKWRFMAKQIPYYGTGKKQDFISQKRYDDAAEQYEKATWDTFIQIKICQATSVAWFGKDCSQIIGQLYNHLREIDKEVVALINDDRKQGADVTMQFKELSDRFSKTYSDEIQNFINRITEHIE